ncbi:MAG: alpha-galactosidase [Firmicutes bacterium]|nr:alpha-galactosidase [Bacillota bacterium]
MVKNKKKTKLALILLVSLAMLLLPSFAAAAEGVFIATEYPGITVRAGESLTFPLDVHNTGSQNQIVALKVTRAPSGWETSLEGGGKKINEIFLKAGTYEDADLRVQVPQDAAEQVYTITVAAFSGDRELAVLNLHVDVSKARAGEDELTAQYSELKGSGSTTFNFKLSLKNNSAEEQTYSLGAELPSGWQITFKPSYEDQEVASVTVKEGETKNLDVTITPASSVEAGEYKIPVAATSAAGSVTEELTVIISGTYKLNFSGQGGILSTDVVAGSEKKITMEVSNTGSAPITNINFTATTPQDWTVTFDEKTIDRLEPGETKQVTATITASSNAIAGDYMVTMRANGKETGKMIEFRVTVKTSTLWGIIAIVIILAVCYGVYWVFRKYGRR